MKSKNPEDNQRKAATLAGPRFVCTSEVDEEHRLNEQLIKDITDGNTLEGRRFYQEAYARACSTQRHLLWTHYLSLLRCSPPPYHANTDGPSGAGDLRSQDAVRIATMT